MFKQGQTVYLTSIKLNRHNEIMYYFVERVFLTNEDVKYVHSDHMVVDGKVSRHWIEDLWAYEGFRPFITRSRRTAIRRCRILNQCSVLAEE